MQNCLLNIESRLNAGEEKTKRWVERDLIWQETDKETFEPSFIKVLGFNSNLLHI